MDGQQTSEAIAEWNARGVLVLPKFYADAEIDKVLADYRALWKEGRARVTVDDMDLARRMRLRDVSADARASHRFKVNDLYLEQASVRRLALNDRLAPLLQRLLGERPAVCNSLSLEYGTEQEDHVDSLFMTPRTPAHLVAVWVALEDCSPESGLLRYWPGSHRIEPYVFSNGQRHFIPEELGAWRDWMRTEVQQHELQSVVPGPQRRRIRLERATAPRRQRDRRTRADTPQRRVPLLLGIRFPGDGTPAGPRVGRLLDTAFAPTDSRQRQCSDAQPRRQNRAPHARAVRAQLEAVFGRTSRPVPRRGVWAMLGAGSHGDGRNVRSQACRNGAVRVCLYGQRNGIRS
ncbi:MAG TPA: phytanoyl-CoA dioxygenase family protein [Rhodanobacteraceae bacterium]|nr:phytanoyl-CoA dioxygenase family protein [Rhodanobacteraceae bacterium]